MELNPGMGDESSMRPITIVNEVVEEEPTPAGQGEKDVYGIDEAE